MKLLNRSYIVLDSIVKLLQLGAVFDCNYLVSKTVFLGRAA